MTDGERSIHTLKAADLKGTEYKQVTYKFDPDLAKKDFSKVPFFQKVNSKP